MRLFNKQLPDLPRDTAKGGHKATQGAGASTRGPSLPHWAHTAGRSCVGRTLGEGAPGGAIRVVWRWGGGTMRGMQEPGSQSSQRPYDDLPCAEGADQSTERLPSSSKVTQPGWNRSEI